MAETKLDQFRRWQVRVDLARRLRTAWETEWKVDMLEQYWAGKQVEDRDDDLAMWFNHFYATERTQKPTLLPRSTSFLVKPRAGRKPFGTTESKTMEAILRAISEQDDNLFTDASLALAQAFFRIGVLKVAYDPRMEPNPRAGEPLPTSPTQLPNEPADVGREPAEVLTDEVYAFEWVDACKMLLPDDGPNMRKWSWLGEEIELTMDEAKDEPRFKASLRSGLKANATTDPTTEGGTFVHEATDKAEEEKERFRYSEIWDIDEKRVRAIADGQDFDEFLMDEEFPEGIDDHPYAILRFVPLVVKTYQSPWPKPVTFDWLPLQEQYNILREMQVNSARRAARKFFMQAETFPDEEELDKLTSNVDMQGVTINDTTRPPVMFGETSQNIDVARNIPFLLNDWRVITGATGTRLGESDANTLGEAVLVEQSANLRDSEARLIVDKWIGKAGQKMLQLVKQTLTLDIWVQLRGFSDKEFKEYLSQPGVRRMLELRYGRDNVEAQLLALEINPLLQERFREQFGNLKPLEVTRSDLQFEADVSVLPSAARPLQQQQLLRLVSVLGPLAFSSPTFLDELLSSFDLPQGSRISEEIMVSLQQARQQAQQQQQQGQAPPQGGGGRQPLRTNGPLGTALGTIR